MKMGYDPAGACDIFGIATPTGYAWTRKWNQYGYEGIVHPFHSSNDPVGRPPILDDDDIETLTILLGAIDDWQVKEVRAIIADTWGIDLSKSQVSRIFKKRLGMHFSKPYHHDYRRPEDTEEQLAEFVRKSINSLINRKMDLGI
jgi:putative transposase